MSCSRSGTGHLISYHARHKVPVADARGIYHDEITAYVTREKAKGHDPYEHVPPQEAVAFLNRQMRLVAEESRSGGLLNKNAKTVSEGILRRIQAIETGQPVGGTPPWVTRAEMHAVSHLPGLIAASARCDKCGRFASQDGNHTCPTTHATKSNKQGTIIPADTSGTWGSAIPADMPDRTFGIETEFTGVELPQAEEATDWEVVEDESVTNDNLHADCAVCDGDGVEKCENCGGWGCPMCGDQGSFGCRTCEGSGMAPSMGNELVSPVLSGTKGLETYRAEIERLRENTSASVDDTCGIHVHVGANDFDIQTLTRLMKLWRKHESAVFSLVNEDRRGSRFCQDLPPEYVSVIERDARAVGLSAAAGSVDRYKALNVQAFQRHGTVEYRLHHGSLDTDEVSDWTQFCVAFTEAATREAAADDLAHAEGIDDVMSVLVRRDLLDRSTAESLMARTGSLPERGVSDPDVPVVAEGSAA